MIDQENTLPFQMTPSELLDAADKYFRASMANKRFEFQRKGMTGLTNETAWADLRIVTWPPCKLAIAVWTVPNGLGIEIEFEGELAIGGGQRIDLEDAWSRFLRSLPVEQQRSVEAGVESRPVAENQLADVQESKRSRTPNPGTENKLSRLIKNRQKTIKETGKAPGWIEACAEIGIDTKTVKEHAEDLRAKWEDIEFLPEPWKYDAGNWEYSEN